MKIIIMSEDTDFNSTYCLYALEYFYNLKKQSIKGVEVFCAHFKMMFKIM